MKDSQVTPHQLLKIKLPKFLKLGNFFPPYLRTQNYSPKPLTKTKSEVIETFALCKTLNQKIGAFAQSGEIGHLFSHRLQQNPLELQELLLDFQTSSKTSQRAVFPDHSMARNDD